MLKESFKWEFMSAPIQLNQLYSVKILSVINFCIFLALNYFGKKDNIPNYNEKTLTCSNKLTVLNYSTIVKFAVGSIFLRQRSLGNKNEENKA